MRLLRSASMCGSSHKQSFFRQSEQVGRVAPHPVTADLFGFLTTDANAEVGAVHPKAMPVILTREEELEAWMTAPWSEAAGLQRPLPDGALRIVAKAEG